MWFRLNALDADYASRAPRSFAFDLQLDVPPDAVFAILADPEQWPKWFPDMKSMRWVGEEREKVGARREAITKTGNVLEHFVVWEPGKRICFYAEKMSVPLVSSFMEDYQLEPTPTGTHMKWLVHYQARLPFRPLQPVLAPIFRKMFAEGVAALPRYVAATRSASA